MIDVALIYDEPRPGPAIHALVIGVGGYDHLEGGVSQKKLERASRYGNLGQLTSPPHSTWAFAEFLRTSRADEWVAPLGTVDLLISTAPGDDDPGGTGGPYDRATRDAIQVAFDAWWDRCHSDPGNVAIFYFCGHGLQATNQVLLPCDFGATGNPWAQAIDLNRTRLAFRANRAETQLFFVDACREITTSNVEVSNPNAPPLREPEIRQPEYCRYDLTIQATSRSQKAYGKPGAVSYFTQAILSAFDGGAARKQNGEWWVRSDLVASRIKEMVRLAGGSDQNPVVITSEPVSLYRLKDVPQAILKLGCFPDEATAVANLACQLLPGGPRQQRPHPEPSMWTLPLSAGFYEIEARFPDGAFLDATDVVAVEPPVTPEKLPVQ